MRDHLELSAARGSQVSQDALVAPEYPDAFAYLEDWLRELHGRSGVGGFGLAPLTYTTIRDWMALKDVHPTPQEIDALMLLDTALFAASAGPSSLGPSSDGDAPARPAPTGPVRVRAAIAAWPSAPSAPSTSASA